MNANATQPTAGGDLPLARPSKYHSLGSGWTWIAEGWALFVKAPLMWIIAVVLLLVISIVLSLFPFIGQAVSQVLFPVFAAGLMLACRTLETGGEFELEHIFGGFKSSRFTSLALLGLLSLAATIVIVLVGLVMMGGAAFSIGAAIMSGSPDELMQAVGASLLLISLGVLVMMALAVPLLAATWFAPALIVLNGLGPAEAMRESFIGCFRNFLAFVVYGIVMLVLLIPVGLTFGLGVIVWVPLAVTSTYTSYRAIFTER